MKKIKSINRVFSIGFNLILISRMMEYLVFLKSHTNHIDGSFLCQNNWPCIQLLFDPTLFITFLVHSILQTNSCQSLIFIDKIFYSIHKFRWLIVRIFSSIPVILESNYPYTFFEVKNSMSNFTLYLHKQVVETLSKARIFWKADLMINNPSQEVNLCLFDFQLFLTWNYNFIRYRLKFDSFTACFIFSSAQISFATY